MEITSWLLSITLRNKEEGVLLKEGTTVRLLSATVVLIAMIGYRTRKY